MGEGSVTSHRGRDTHYEHPELCKGSKVNLKNKTKNYVKKIKNILCLHAVRFPYGEQLRPNI